MCVVFVGREIVTETNYDKRKPMMTKDESAEPKTRTSAYSLTFAHVYTNTQASERGSERERESKSVAIICLREIAENTSCRQLSTPIQSERDRKGEEATLSK